MPSHRERFDSGHPYASIGDEIEIGWPLFDAPKHGEVIPMKHNGNFLLYAEVTCIDYVGNVPVSVKAEVVAVTPGFYTPN